MTRVEVDPLVLLCAFRYALGRRTAVVSTVTAALIEHAAVLGTYRPVIRREITAAIGRDEAGAGDDVAGWRRVHAALVAADPPEEGS